MLILSFLCVLCQALKFVGRFPSQGWGTNEKALVEILGRRTAAQRAEIRRAYASLYKESLLTRLHGELSGHFQVLASHPHPQSINGSLYCMVMICAAVLMMTMCSCVN